MDEGETGTRVEGARERGVEVRKRDLRASGKSQRGGDRMREEGTPVRIAGILGNWTGRALERNALFLREHGERTWGAEARVDVELRPWAGGGAEAGDSQ